MFKYGLEMSTANFSVYKSQIKVRGWEGQTDPAKRGRRLKGWATSRGSAAGVIQRVKALVNLYGAETVQGVADVFGKEQG